MAELLIVGAGAIGGLLAARIASTSIAVTLVGRPAWRDAVQREGLRLRIGTTTHPVHGLRTCASLAEAAEGHHFDWLLLATRAYSVTAAVEEAVAALDPMPPVVCFQNGIGSEEAAQRVAGSRGVVAATITTPVQVLSPTVLETVDKGGVGLARWAGGPDPSPLAACLDQAGFRVRQYGDARAMKWSKLLLNVIGNATSALLGWTPSQVMAEPSLFAIEVAALTEALTVMERLGVRPVALPGYPVPLQMALLSRLPLRLSRPVMQRLVAKGRGGKLPSLALALQQGARETEVTVLNGAVAAEGARLGIATPINVGLARLVTAVAEGILPPDAFHDAPSRLIIELRDGAQGF